MLKVKANSISELLAKLGHRDRTPDISIKWRWKEYGQVQLPGCIVASTELEVPILCKNSKEALSVITRLLEKREREVKPVVTLKSKKRGRHA